MSINTKKKSSVLSRRIRVDPAEWAARRKKAMALANTLRQERKSGLHELRDDVSNFRQLSNGKLSQDESRHFQKLQCDPNEEVNDKEQSSCSRKPVTTPLTEDETTVSSETLSKSRITWPSRNDYCRPPSSSQSSIISATTFCSSAKFDEDHDLRQSSAPNQPMSDTHLYVPPQKSDSSVKSKLSRPRQKLQNALLYPLTEETFNETGKLSLLQQRLLFRRNKCNWVRRSTLQVSHMSNNTPDSTTPIIYPNTMNHDTSFDVQIKKNQKETIETLGSCNNENSIETNYLTHGNDPILDNITKHSSKGLSTSIEEYKEIQLIHCSICGKSYSREVYERRCKVGKCKLLANQKRKVFSSARARITSNSHLSEREKSSIIDNRKKIVAEKKQGNGSFKRSFSASQQRWKQQSADLREAMKANRLIAKAEKEGKPAHFYL